MRILLDGLGGSSKFFARVVDVFLGDDWLKSTLQWDVPPALEEGGCQVLGQFRTAGVQMGTSQPDYWLQIEGSVITNCRETVRLLEESVGPVDQLQKLSGWNRMLKTNCAADPRVGGGKVVATEISQNAFGIWDGIFS